MTKRLILPDPSAGRKAEPLRAFGGSKKRIDVVVAQELVGLEIGVSLKGMNFDSGGNYAHNLTGRLYELADEMAVVHEYLPRAFMVAVFFQPIRAAFDKTRVASSFAKTVLDLRARTGRLDPSMEGQFRRADCAFVCLYSDSDHMGVRRGVGRCHSVDVDPPYRGLPRLADTRSFGELGRSIIDAHDHQTEPVAWNEPDPYEPPPDAIR